MNKYLYCFFILLLFPLSGCQNKTSTKFPITERTNVHKTDKTDIFLGLPIDMQFKNKNIYISDFYGDSLLTRYNINTGLINKFGTKGIGPNEILPPTTITVKDDKLYAFSKSNFKFGYFKLPSDEEKIIQQNNYRFLFTPLSQTTEIVPLSDNNFLSSGYYKEGRYAILDKNGSILHLFGEYPDFCESEKERPFEVKAMFHQVIFEPNYRLQKVVAISNYIMDIIDYSNHDFKYQRILLNNYNYDFHSGDILQAKKSKTTPKGIISVSVSDNFIYTLFNPNSDSNEKLNNEIWIFDWTGKAIKKIITNININLIVIDSDSSIYGITATEEPYVVNLKFDNF